MAVFCVPSHKKGLEAQKIVSSEVITIRCGGRGTVITTRYGRHWTPMKIQEVEKLLREADNKDTEEREKLRQLNTNALARKIAENLVDILDDRAAAQKAKQHAKRKKTLKIG